MISMKFGYLSFFIISSSFETSLSKDLNFFSGPNVRPMWLLKMIISWCWMQSTTSSVRLQWWVLFSLLGPENALWPVFLGTSIHRICFLFPVGQNVKWLFPTVLIEYNKWWGPLHSKEEITDSLRQGLQRASQKKPSSHPSAVYIQEMARVWPKFRERNSSG